MPRKPRINAPGTINHIIARGIEYRRIFEGKKDYTDFIERLEYSLEASGCQCLAWALMPDHFHLLIRSGEHGISPMMRKLMTGYATSFNHRHKRVGHLFANRYKSIICDEESYLLELVRYIHLNPLRDNLVHGMEELKKYRWCGHGALMGENKLQWQKTEDMLHRFGSNINTARKKYEEFVKAGLNKSTEIDFEGGGLTRSAGGATALRGKTSEELFDERILGGEDFVEAVLKAANEKHEIKNELKRKAITVEDVLKTSANEYGLSINDLKSRSRTDKISKAKAIAIYICENYLGKTNKEMAELTRMSGAAASQAKERGRELIKGSSFIDNLIT